VKERQWGEVRSADSPEAPEDSVEEAAEPATEGMEVLQCYFCFPIGPSLGHSLSCALHIFS